MKDTKEVFTSVLDAFLAELSQRFDEKNIDIMRAIPLLVYFATTLS